MRKLGFLILVILIPMAAWHVIPWLFQHGSSSAFDAGVVLSFVSVGAWLASLGSLLSR